MQLSDFVVKDVQMILFLALNPDNSWTRLSIATHHYGTKAMQKIIETVLPPSKTLDLHHEMKRLIQMRPPRAFTFEEKALLVPTPPRITDTSTMDITLINKIIGQCLDGRYVYKRKSFEKPTGLRMNSQNIPNLANANLSDFSTLIKDFRNTVMHWPDQYMNQYDFDRFWNFLEDILNFLGLNCPDLANLKYGGYIMPDQFINSFTQIMKDSRREVGKVFRFCTVLINYHLDIFFA